MLKAHILKLLQPEAVNIKLSWARLRFLGSDSAQLEKAFKENYFFRNLSHLRQCHIITIIFYLLAGMIDYLLFPNDLVVLFSIRFLIVIPIFVVGYLFTYSRHYRHTLKRTMF